MCTGKSDGKTAVRARRGLPLRGMRYVFAAAAMLAVLCPAAPFAAAQSRAPDSVKIYTDTYRPYVNPAGEADGSAMRLVRLIVRNMGLSPDFEHIDFGYALHATAKSQNDLSFPWLKTPEREKQVLYSVPLYATQSRFHYNIRFHPDGIAAKDLAGQTYGRVSNYSYGPEIDEALNAADRRQQAKTFASDADAIKALLAGEIDLLPQISSVLEATLNAGFANQSRLIRPVPGIMSSSPNYVVASKTARGKAMITAFNESYSELKDAGIISPETLDTAISGVIPSDIGVIVASEGFPVITGTSRDNPAQTFAIPPGTRVLILEWSRRILAPSDADQLYKTMVDETLVLILNGPHIGKELRIKNMHITIAP